jgi:hypothetical protein
MVQVRCLISSILFILTPVCQAHGYTKSGKVYTTDGSQADVSAAIASAQPGETVRIPAGVFTWGAGGSHVDVNKAITLAGAGPGATTIVLADNAGTWTAATIRISAAATIRGFTVVQPGTGNTTAFSCGSANGWRITNIQYQGASPEGYFCYVGGVYGLIDACDITGGGGSSELIFGRGPADSWQTPSSQGTANAVYIEDCIFNGPGYVCDANSNARFVVRYCTIRGVMKVDAHGLASNTPARGVRHMEIYGNSWTSGGNFWAAMELRGGTGMVFDNTASADTSRGAGFILHEYGCTGLWGNFGRVYQTPADYPVKDQIGVGKDPKQGGSEPYYAWHNIRNGSAWIIGWKTVPAAAITRYQEQTGDSSATFTMRDMIMPDRDYFEQGPTFDGSGGIGIGTKSQMLAITPTLANVGFWVTDEGEWNASQSGPDGQLYVWTGGKWVLKYIPYQYPHPLRIDGALRAPFSLRIIK